MTRTTCSTWTMITPWLTCQPGRPIITAWHRVDGSPLYPHTLSELNRIMIVINLYLSRRHQFIRGFVSQMHRTDSENGGFIFVCSLDSKLAWGWWGSVWKRREQKKEEDKDRRRQRVLRAGAAERWYTIVIDHTDSKQLRMCVICGGLWGFEFPPTVASFYARLCVCGRR